MDKREDEPADKHENTHDDYKSELEQRQLQQHEGEEPAVEQPPAEPPAVEQVTLVVEQPPAGLGEFQYSGYYCLWLVEDTHLAPGHFAPFVPVGAEFFLGDGCVAASATASPAHSSDVAPASDEDASGAE